MRVRFFGWLACLGIVAGCSSSQTYPMRTLPTPSATTDRDSVVFELGRRAFSALQHRTPRALLLDDDGLRAVLEPEAAGRAAAMHGTSERALQLPPDSNAALAGVSYLGVCVQHAHLEPAGRSLGLRQAAFVVDRALVVGVEPGGGRVAAWVEGTFVLTDQGFFALSLQRLETPRRDHADLDLAPCDLQIGLRSPPRLVVSDPESH